jgi:hypothetical protein
MRKETPVVKFDFIIISIVITLYFVGLIIASGRGQVETVKLLLKYGANIEDHTSSGIFEGKTAICWASSQGR